MLSPFYGRDSFPTTKALKQSKNAKDSTVLVKTPPNQRMTIQVRICHWRSDCKITNL